MIGCDSWRQVDPAVLREVLAGLREYDRVIARSELAALTARFGWRATVEPGEPEVYFSDTMVRLNTSWGLRNRSVEIRFFGDEIHYVEAIINSFDPPAGSSYPLLAQDALVEYVAVAGESLGPPTSWDNEGGLGFLWRGAHMTIALRRVRSSVFLSMGVNSQFE